MHWNWKDMQVICTHTSHSNAFETCLAVCDDSAGRWPLKCVRTHSQGTEKIACQLPSNNNSKQLHENCQRLMFIGIRNRPSSFQFHRQRERERETCTTHVRDAKWKAKPWLCHSNNYEADEEEEMLLCMTVESPSFLMETSVSNLCTKQQEKQLSRG